MQFYTIVVAAYVLEELYVDGTEIAMVDADLVTSDVYTGWINYLFYEKYLLYQFWGFGTIQQKRCKKLLAGDAEGNRAGISSLQLIPVNMIAYKGFIIGLNKEPLTTRALFSLIFYE